MMKKLGLIFMTVLFLASGNSVFAKTQQPEIYGANGVAIDATTGEILYNKYADEKAYPASMTKVMTSILLMEHMGKNGVIKATDNAMKQECSCFGLKKGQTLSRNNALYAMLLVSANDLAVAIAENIAGSVPAFADMMNEKARELGLKNTHFVTPNGLHDPNHYVSAHDMALIMKEAQKYPTLMKALETNEKLIQTNQGSKKVFAHGGYRKNPLVLGGKTGFTNEAGNTIAAFMQEGTKRVIVVVMKSNPSNDSKDIDIMGRYALSKLGEKDVVTKGENMGTVQVAGKKLSILSPETVHLTYDNSQKQNFKVTVQKKDELSDVKKGQKVATIDVFENKNLVQAIPVYSDKTIHKVVKEQSIKWKNIWIGMLIPVPFYLIYLIQYNRNKRKRKTV